MLTRFDVESAAGSRACVSGVSGKAFTIVLEVRTGSPQTKTAYDSTAKDEGRINFMTKTRRFRMPQLGLRDTRRSRAATFEGFVPRGREFG